MFNNVENEIGRMYRYFINEGTVKIKFKYFKKERWKIMSVEEQIVRPNDPLYQMKNSTCPKPWDKKLGFAEAETEKILVGDNGNNEKLN